MGQARKAKRAAFRNRPENLARSFYEGKLSQRDAAKMRTDRLGEEIASGVREPYDPEFMTALEQQYEPEPNRTWFYGVVLVGLLITTALLWWGVWWVVK
jgi:hypothetical protein